MKLIAGILLALLLAVGGYQRSSGQTPPATATPEATPVVAATPTVTPVDGSTVSPPTDPADDLSLSIVEPSLPDNGVTISAVSSIAAQLIEDMDGDGKVSAGDAPAVTIIDLILVPGGGFKTFPERALLPPEVSLFTGKDGRFELSHVPAGTYQLWIWWGAGFYTLPTAPTNEWLVIAGVTVRPDGHVTGAIPSTMLLKKRPFGVIGYSPRAAGAEPIAGGRANVRSVLAGRATAALPAAGDGSSLDRQTLLTAVGAALLALAALGGVGLSLRRSRR